MARINCFPAQLRNPLIMLLEVLHGQSFSWLLRTDSISWCLEGGRDTLPSLSVSGQSLLWIGSHSGQWGSRYLQSNQAGFQNVGQQTVGKLLILADFCAACHTAQGVGCEWSIRNAVHVVCGPCMLTRPSKKRGEARGSPLQCISYDSSSSLNMNCCSHSPWQNVFVFPRNSF